MQVPMRNGQENTRKRPSSNCHTRPNLPGEGKLCSTSHPQCVGLPLAATDFSKSFLDSVTQYIHNWRAFPNQPLIHKPKNKIAKYYNYRTENMLIYSRADKAAALWTSVVKHRETVSSSSVMCVRPKKIKVKPEVKH